MHEETQGDRPIRGGVPPGTTPPRDDLGPGRGATEGHLQGMPEPGKDWSDDVTPGSLPNEEIDIRRGRVTDPRDPLQPMDPDISGGTISAQE